MKNRGKITEAIANLRIALEENTDDACVAVRLFFNSEGHELTEEIRLPEDLKHRGISMRNLRGDFVKGQL